MSGGRLVREGLRKGEGGRVRGKWEGEAERWKVEDTERGEKEITGRSKTVISQVGRRGRGRR